MIMGAVCGFVTAHHTGSPTLAFTAGMAGGAALALLFAVLTQLLMANQVASGLALTLFRPGPRGAAGGGVFGPVGARGHPPFPETLRAIPRRRPDRVLAFGAHLCLDPAGGRGLVRSGAHPRGSGW